MATTKRKAFAAELTAALSKKSGLSSNSSAQYSQSSGHTVIYTTIRDYNPEGAEKEDGLRLKKGERVVLIQKSPDPESKRAKLDDSELRQEIGGSLLDSSAAKHKLSVRPPKNHPSKSRDASPDPGAASPPEALDASSRLLVQSLDSEATGWVPRCLLVKQEVQTYEHEEMELESEIVMESAGGATDALYCREAIVRELVDTEEEFGRDLQAVVDHYLKPLDHPSVPRAVRDNKEVVFSNLKQISEFHNTVLIEGVKYYADEPRMLGKTFLRLERDFDKHVQYCRDEPIAQEFLQENAEAREYFEERAQSLGDERSLSEHLKLPIQRIHDYQLLLKDLVRYSRKLGEDVTDLNRALELMLAIPHKASDNKFISNIEGYHGNIHKLGRLLRHDWFKVKFADTAKEKERYLFLFKARILICKVRKIAGDRSVFVLKHIIRLPEVEVRDHPESPLTFEFRHKFPDTAEYPITLEAHRSPAKSDWLSEIRQYAADILALAEHAADDLRVQQEGSESKFGSLKGVDLEITDDIVAEDIEQFTDSSSASHPLIEEQRRIKSQLKHVTVPERPPLEIPKKKEIFRFSDEDELVEEEIQFVAPAVEKRIEAGELVVKEESSQIVTSRSVRVEETGSVVAGSKKLVVEETDAVRVSPSSKDTSTLKDSSHSVEQRSVKDSSHSVDHSSVKDSSTTLKDISSIAKDSSVSESAPEVIDSEEDMDRYSVRSSGTRFRSVSSKVSEEVFVQSSGTGGNTTSSSRSFAVVEESINGRTVRRDVMSSASDNLGGITDSARIKAYDRTDSVGSGCAIEEISSVRHLDGKTYDNNNEEIEKATGGRTARRSVLEDNGEQFSTTSSASTVRKSSKYSTSSTLDDGDTSSVRTKRVEEESSRGKRPPVLDEEEPDVRRTKKSSLLDEEATSITRTSKYGREEEHSSSFTSKRSAEDEEDSLRRTKKLQDEEETSRRTKKLQDDEETSRRTKKLQDEEETSRLTRAMEVDVHAESYGKKISVRSDHSDQEGPVFTKPLESYAVKVGENATLECDVDADVLWLKNNRPIPLELGNRYYPSSHDQIHHTLQIMGVRESDEDSFTVRATNEDGAVSYCTTRLTVEHGEQEETPDGSPKFLIAMRNTTVIEKTFLRFMVKVSGHPKPEVKFYKDDRFITPANSRVKVEKSRSNAGYYELILPQVTEEDAGTYKCIAMNEHGEAESEATLSVTDDKTIFFGLGDSELLKSGETPQFQWLRDGQPFQPEERFKVDYKDEGDSLQLVFQNVKPEDAGLYTCVGTTSTGRLACSAELTIQGSVNQLAREPAAPKMKADTKTFESSLGSTAMMEFTCEGYPKPYLKVEKDGRELELGTKAKFMYESEENVILAIKNLEAEDAGKYKLEAMNELGSDTQEFNLSIKAPPKFRNKLGEGDDVNVMVGQELKLSIGVDGIPKPDVKWLKDGKPVKETKDLVLSYDDAGVHTLTIEKATLKDSASYSITATNEMSTITDFTRVTVHAPPQFLRTMTKTVDCNVGDVITYQIKVEGDPLPEVKWMKDNEVLQIDEQHLKVTADGQVHSLIINKVKREDTGKYSALISNDHGSSQDDGRMNVRCAPLFSKQLTDFYALEGDQNVEFLVNIDSYPKPVIKWFHDKTEITDKLTEFIKVEDTEAKNYKLILKQVEREHAGKYICEVSNNLGKIKCEANFVVKAKPRFKKTLPETVEIDEGKSLSLSIEVEAVPEPDVKWYRNGEEVSADANIKITRDSKRVENYNLTVTLALPEDGGEYEVRATNEVGSAVTKSRVLVHFPAQIIEEKMDARKVFETLSTVFEVIATGYPQPEATWFKDGEVLEESERLLVTNEGKSYKLEIVKTTHADKGEYSVQVKNRLGEASSKGSLEIEDVRGLRSPRIKTPLESLIIHKFEKAVFTAVVIAYPEPDIKWTIAGKDPQAVVEYIVDTKELDYGLLECTFTLLIPNGHHCHTGDVLFVASNDYGSCETGARLDVLLRPEIQAFKDMTCEPYQTTAFEVEIDANPKPRVTWSFKGEKILGTDPRVQITSEPEKDLYKLTIRNVGLGDEGVYEVEASNNLGVASAIARLKVHRQLPTFIKRLDEQTVREYSPLEAKVRAEGIPKPVLKWMKGGELINEDLDDRIRIETTNEGVVTSTLYITHFAPEHVGKYTVLAANLVGEVECFARFRMQDLAPMFTRPLNRSLEVQEGHPIELRAQLEASPLAQLRWTKNGEKLHPSERIEISSTPDGAVKLSIQEAQLSDSGAYKLFAYNDNGEAHCMCAVVVDPEDKAPAIAQGLSEVIGYEGEPLKLTALIEGFPVPSITWMKDSHILHSGSGCSMVNKPSPCGNFTEVSLILPNPGPRDAGRYSFVAQNKLGDAESSTRVEIARKETIPRFSLQLNPGKVIEGYPVKLQVKAYAFPEPELQWTFNNHPFMPDGIHSRLLTDADGTQTLLIDKAQPDDAGVYAVIATNNRGTASTRGILDVQPTGIVDEEERAPGFVHNFKDLTVDEDTPIDFNAPFIGNPIPTVEWFKDGIPVIPSKRLQFSCDGIKVGLNIPKAEPVDAGKYTCTLENKLGKASSSGNINVRKLYQKPNFLQRFTDQQQLPKRDAKFLARVTGVPTPSVQWYRDGIPIDAQDDKYRVKRDDEMCVLYVRRCDLNDEAEYKLIARNREGEDSCEARLKVVDQLEKQEKIEPPSFLKRIGDCEVYPGMSAKFTACITGYPVPSVEWTKNGEVLEPSDRVQIDNESSGMQRLIIHRTDLEEDSAVYKCRIWNLHGEASCEAKLLFETLEIRPKAPVGELYSDYDRIRSTGIPLPLADKPIISRMTDHSLTLSWKPSIPYGARYPVTYHVEMCDLPDGDWFTARMGIRSCACEIANLAPFRDYKFRIRVENKYGLSDPSPFAQTLRERLNPERPRWEPYLPPGIPFNPDKSFYFPHNFDLERPPREGYAQAPRFLNQEHETQYGIKNENSSLFWFVYGYPKPKVSFYFNGELIEMGGRYDSSYTRNGMATLFINKMLDRDVGVYEAMASNEHGTARQRVRLEIAEYPHFIKRPEESYVMMRRTVKLEARIWGVPYPEIKWYKDWQLLTESSRHKITWTEPDLCTLTIGDCIGRDEGLYSVTARNIAGTISHSVTVHVEDNETEYSYNTYSRGRQVKARTKQITDAYDLGDELGRGVTGIVYHAVERSSGRNYAAKVMTGKGGEYRSLFKNELDIMNQLCHRNLIRLHDSYENNDKFTIISELAGGGELLHSLTRLSHYTEYDIAFYMRQLLSGLDYMHRLSIAHLGLTPGDLLISHPGGRELKLTDFGLSRRITSFGKLAPLHYGMPEFVSPEVASGKGVDFCADMWSTGVITYLLLTGVSLFRGLSDAETLDKIKDGHFMFRQEHWGHLSEEARDFISKLIVVDPGARMDVKQALRHPWLNFADRKPTEDTPKLSTDALRNYYNLYKDWTGAAAVRRHYRRRPLSSCYTQPTRMLYPPGVTFTPEPTPDRQLVSRDLQPAWENPHVDRMPPTEYDVNIVKSESHYQNGPDTYLLQLRDVDFPCRLREYIKVASTRPDLRLSTGFNCLDTSENGHLDWKAPVIRERRRFTDVMDEEIDDERRNRINKYGAADTYTLRRLRHEIGTRPEAHVEADALIESRRDGHAPFFREKPITIPVVIGDRLEMKCFAVGEPKPLIQWFKNELVITESSRVKFREDKDGRCIMSIEPVLNADLGIFKIVARNKKGQTVTRCRVVEATTPMAPDSPEAVDISDTEILLRWKQPSYDGHAPVICYSLQYKEADEVEWINLANNIDHEFWHVKDLKRETNYVFRLSAKNTIGWSEKGIPSALFKTKPQGNGQYKVDVSSAMRHIQAVTEAGHTPSLATPPPPLNYSVEEHPVEWSTDTPTDKYQFISEIHRGKFSVVVKAAEKGNSENIVAAKLFEYSHETLHQVNSEFDNLRSLRHERLASLIEAFKPSTTASNIAVLVMEKLQGADVLSYLSSRHEYTEQNVATIISQVLDGLQYLHWRGLCHLNLEPDNVVMASVRSVQVKLIDLGCAQRVTKLGTLIHPINTPNPEFAAPETLADEPIYPQTDVWGAGVLAYVLLSGASPFRGDSDLETRQNVNYVRYRFEYLFKELTQEATRFLMLIFKRAPGKRPSVEECHENRWLVPSEYMIKKRERAVFLGNRLKEFSDEYHDLKNKQYTSDSLSALHKTLSRSNSIQEELISTAFTSHLVNKPSSDSSTL